MSSTQADLANERDAVYEVLAERFDVVRMEDFGSDDLEALEKCLDEVESCDALVLLLGHRYGTIAPDSGMSYTHLEYERARECDIPVFAYIRAGFDAALDEADHPAKLADFKDQIEDAHTVERRYFTSPEEIASQVYRDVDRWANRAANRPAFTKRLGSVANPFPYGVNTDRYERLQLSTFPVSIVDLSVVEARQYRFERRGLVGRKIALLADALRKSGVQVSVFNNLPADDPGSVVEQRVRVVLRDAAVIICFVPREEDFAKLAYFIDSPEKLHIWYPRRVVAPGLDAAIFVREYTQDELKTCHLAGQILAHVEHLVDRHLLEHSLA